jgi:hypothetical protein
MSDLTVFPADLAEMSVSQLANLPPAQLAEADANLDHLIDWAKKTRTKLDAALDQRFGEQGRTALRDSGRDFGTAHISDGPLHIKFEMPKKVSWNQKQLTEIAERIVSSGEKATSTSSWPYPSRVTPTGHRHCSSSSPPPERSNPASPRSR